QRTIDKMTMAEAEKYMAEGQFPAGSMGPKIQAAIMFLKNGGEKVIITSPEFIGKAVNGETGTHITK
ncbi:MAG TPA: carbamate kinase, partial [Candidatus Wallbacteria bacterium]|nr:carbamate kinase [Candidatus Wallbacteria bacterium]